MAKLLTHLPGYLCALCNIPSIPSSVHLCSGLVLIASQLLSFLKDLLVHRRSHRDALLGQKFLINILTWQDFEGRLQVFALELYTGNNWRPCITPLYCLQWFTEMDRWTSEKLWLRKQDSLVSNGRPRSVRPPKSAWIRFATSPSNAYVYGWLDAASERRDSTRLEAWCGNRSECERQREGVQVCIHSSCHSQAYMSVRCSPIPPRTLWHAWTNSSTHTRNQTHTALTGFCFIPHEALRVAFGQLYQWVAMNTGDLIALAWLEFLYTEVWCTKHVTLDWVNSEITLNVTGMTLLEF